MAPRKPPASSNKRRSQLLLSKETRHSGLSEVEGQNPAISPLPVFAVILSGVWRALAPNAVEGPLYLSCIA